MSTNPSLPALGLAVDQHPGMAPKGAMSQADNVVGDLPGMLRGRPNTFVSYSEDPVDPDDYERIDTLIRVGDEWLAHQGKSGPDAMWRNQDGALTGMTAGAYPSTDDPADSAEARGSTYIGTDGGIAKLESATASALLAAGVEMTMASYAGNLPRVVPSGSVPEPPAGPFTSPFTVGYRLVIKRTDGNDYVARSAPSPILPVYSPGPTTWTDVAIILLGDALISRWYFEAGSIRTGDVVEFYRSRILTTGNDGPIAPDYYLVASYEVTAQNVIDGYFPESGSETYVYDTLEDSQLGEALYVNPGRGGALAAKYTPPISRAVELWAGVMWYGYVRERERAAFQLVDVGGGATARGSDGQSLGVTSLTGAILTGDPVIDLADVTGIRVGQYVFDDPSGPQTAGDFPALTQVLSISGAGPYAVTVSANATVTDATAALYFGDYIDIDGTRFYASLGSSLVDQDFAVSDNADPSMRAAATADALSRAVNSWMVVNGGEVRIAGTVPVKAAAVGSAGSFTVEATAPDGTFTVGPTSAPYAFAPAIEKLVGYGATVKRNRLYFSDPEEPEAVRLLSYIDVGASQHGILALSALNDALLVWKEDGLFRITGAAPNRWAVEVLDPTLVLARSCAVDVLRGTAYAVTNRGVVAVGAGGISALPAQGKVETLFREPTLPQVVAWEQLGLVLFSALLTGQGDDYADTVYCYAVATGVWSRWPNMWHSTMSGAGRDAYPFMAATRADSLPLFEVRRFLPDEGRGYDHAWESVTISSRTGSTLVITDAARGDWYPRVGDWLQLTVLSIWRRVLSVVYDGFAGTWTLTCDGAIPGAELAATLTAYEGAPVQLEWLPSVSASGTPFTLPLWRGVSFSFSSGPATVLAQQLTARLVFGVRHDQSQTVPEVVATPDRSVAAMRPYRMGWPRNGARRPVVWPRLGFSEIAWPWRLSGIALTGEGGSERTRR